MLETLILLILFMFLNLIFIIRPTPIAGIPIAVITFYIGSSRLLAVTSLDIKLDVILSFTVLIFACINMYVNGMSFSRKKTGIPKVN